MTFPSSDSTSGAGRKLPASKPPKIPRIDSLLHQVQHATDAGGQPTPLFDALLRLLENPPAGVADRWQKGADLCQSHGIQTSRMSVWRLYRKHLLQRCDSQNPTPTPSLTPHFTS